MVETAYKNQAKLRIRLACGIPITGALETEIRYRKPNGATGKWEASVSDAERGIIEYNVTGSSILDVAGPWTLWSYVVFSDNRGAPGAPYRLLVKEEGE